VVVYLRQEGRGIGLVNKLKAYSLQDLGFDTVEANERLGFPADLRDYGMGAQMLNDLGIKHIRLITNNPRKISGLKGYGLEIIERVPLLIEANSYNSVYLATKAEKLGHLLLNTYLITVSLNWQNPLRTPTERYEILEKLRHLIRPSHLQLQEEVRPVAIALFGKQSLIFHLGLDQSKEVASHWYEEKDHPFRLTILAFLDQIVTWPNLASLEFLLSNGHDPMTGLQVSLERTHYGLEDLLPSQQLQALTTQTIYSYSQKVQ
jgi:3,4-dihydroxy 2-butanone 4-phosphate synthase/GTP cyclohydrolase II